MKGSSFICLGKNGCFPHCAVSAVALERAVLTRCLSQEGGIPDSGWVISPGAMIGGGWRPIGMSVLMQISKELSSRGVTSQLVSPQALCV